MKCEELRGGEKSRNAERKMCQNRETARGRVDNRKVTADE